MAVGTDHRKVSEAGRTHSWKLGERQDVVAFGKSLAELTVDLAESEVAHLAGESAGLGEGSLLLPATGVPDPFTHEVKSGQHFSFNEHFVEWPA